MFAGFFNWYASQSDQTNVKVITYIFLLFAVIPAQLTAIVFLTRRRLRPSKMLFIAVGAIGCVLFLVREYWLTQTDFSGWDYAVFRDAGKELLAGRSPYRSVTNGMTMLNPPTSFPWIAAFASVPFRLGFRTWSAINVLFALALVPLARRVLASQGLDPASKLSNGMVCVLGVAVVLCNSTFLAIDGGQFSLLTTVALFAALDAQGRGKGMLAGLFLAIAAVKPNTMLPFLLLFLGKRSERTTWATLSLIGLGFVIADGGVSGTHRHLQELLEALRSGNGPGKINDYGFAGPSHESIVGFDSAAYCLGLRDRAVIDVVKWAALVGLGLWPAFEVVWRKRISRPVACAVTACFSMLFLYHRVYDASILVLPLVLCAGRIGDATNDRSRFLNTCCSIAILAVYNLSRVVQLKIEAVSMKWGALGRIARAVLLPYSTWVILAVMFALFFDELARLRNRLASERKLDPMKTGSP